MSVDIVLVSGERLTLAEVRERFADPGVQAVLGPAAIGGTPEEFPRITRVDTERLSVDLYGPQESQTGGGVAPYTTDLGVLAPSDETGSSWWTQVDIVRGADDDPAVEALLGVLASLAAAGRGHVVVEGELIELPGVPPPTPDLTGATDEPVSAPATDSLFLGLFAPFRAPDQAGWDRVIRLVHALTTDVPELWPRYVDVDGDWRAFDATPHPPAWWPMAQRLGGAEPPATWELEPAAAPHEALTAIHLRATTAGAETPRMLPALLRADVSYAYLHRWTPAEQLPDSHIGLRGGGPETPPWVLMTERDLRVALPGPFWVQVIGPEWVAVIGRDRLASTPAHRVEELAPGRWLIQLTASAADLAGIGAAREAVRAHLGPEVFWTRDTEEQPRVDFAAGADTRL